MSDQEIRIRISADGAAQAGAAFGKAAGDLGKFAPAGRSATQSLAQVNMQLTDIAVSLGSGQSPFTVLLQQGGQLKDLFGGVGGAVRAVGSGIAAALNPVTVVGGMFAVLGAAAWQGAKESDALRDSLILTGNAAGVTAESLDITSRRVADHANTTIGSAREITAGLVATGQVGGAAIGSLGTAAAMMAEITGKSSDEVVKDFAGMSGGVTDWAAQHNKAWHFVSAAQLDHIRTLEEQGDKTGAMIVVGDALTDHLARQRDSLGYLETAWNLTAKAASSFWDMLKDIGRDDTAIEKIQETRAELERLRRMAETPVGGWLGKLLYGSEAQAQGRVDTANRDALRQQENALAAGEDAEKQARLSQQRKELAALTARLSGETSSYQRALTLLVQAEKDGTITEERRLELTRQLALEQGKAGKSAEQLAADKKRAAEAAEREYQAMVKSTIANRAPRLADIEAAGTEQANAAAERNMQQTAADLRRRNDLAHDLGLQLEEDTARLNISLIEDDQERGLAQIELERQTMQARLDVLKAGGADITAAQEALNANIIAKTKALKSQLTEEWTSVSRLGEDAFATLMGGGKLDLASMAKQESANWARRTWRKDVEPLFADNAKGLKELLGITQKQTDAAGAATRSTKLFGGGLETLTDSFTDTAQEVWKWVTNLTSDSGSGDGGGGMLGGLMGWVTSLFGGSSGGDVGITSGNMGLADYGLGGGRATGGMVMRGRDYWVGEYGPEKLRMLKGGNGFITPTGGTPRGAAPGPVFNVTNHFAPGVSPAQFAAGLEQQRRQTLAEVLESAARPGRELWRLNRGG